MELKIDYIFPWVNPADIFWQKKHKQYSPKNPAHDSRFRDLGLLKYVFRGLEVNMPWLNSVILLVDSYTQIPKWLNKACPGLRIITHPEFIPREYLPTFNSNTIEMFLGNIPETSEYIIYGNDDFFPINPSLPEDYFYKTPAGEIVPQISYKILSKNVTKFQSICKRTTDLAKKYSKSQSFLKLNEYYKQSHGPQPIKMSAIKNFYTLAEKELLNSITRFRDLDKNMNQYVFYNYCILNCNHKKRNSLTTYIEYNKAKKDNAQNIVKHIKNDSTPWLCYNDTAKTVETEKTIIIAEFEKKFPNRSKYELPDAK